MKDRGGLGLVRIGRKEMKIGREERCYRRPGGIP